MWRRRRIFDDFFRELEEIDRIFDRMFESMRSWRSAEELDKPLYWGFSVRIGPEGVPEVQTFGNVEAVSPTLRAGVREPYVETMIDEKNSELVVTAELPGVSKDDIQINATENEVEIKAEKGDRKYHRVIPLDAEVDPESARAKYNNGVLEVKLKLKSKPSRGVNVKVE